MNLHPKKSHNILNFQLPDGRALVDHAANECSSYRADFGSSGPIKYLVERISGYMQAWRGVERRIPPTGESESSPENTLQLYGAAAGGAGGAGGKRSSLATADTASIATNSSANTFIVKSDYGVIKVLLTCFFETLPDE